MDLIERMDLSIVKIDGSFTVLVCLFDIVNGHVLLEFNTQLCLLECC